MGLLKAATVLSPEQLSRVVRVILILEDLGVSVLERDGSTADVQAALMQNLRAGIPQWPPARCKDLVTEKGPTGGLPRLCRDRPALADCVRSVLSCRLVQAMAEACSSLRQKEDLARVRAALTDWGDCARRANASGLL